jgi:hypothetical protein
MVSGFSSFRVSWAGLLLMALPLHAALPDYKLGDIAQEDVITPVSLTVQNAEATEELKRREASRVQMIFRVNPVAAREAEADLRASFEAARAAFDDAVKRKLKEKPASELASGSPQFQQVVAAARQRAPGFPLMEQLAPKWARNETDEATQTALLRELRAVMSRPVIAGRVAGYGPRSSVRLVNVTSFEEAIDPREVEQLGRLVPADDVLVLSRASRLVQSNLLAQLRVAGPYLAKFIRTNAMADLELTGILRAQRTENLAVLDRYQSGQAVIRRGQVMDQTALAALAALRDKLALTDLQTELAVRRAAPVEAGAERWLPWAVAGFGLVLGLLVVLLRRVGAVQKQTLLPVLARQPEQLSAGEETWRERALVAEAHAAQAKQAIKGSFLQWMRERLVSGLFHQRAQLLSSQQKAEAEMRALDERLERLHAPLQERIATYEERIAELEKELAAKGAENRELIKAKISLAKQQLSVERERSRAGFGTN